MFAHKTKVVVSAGHEVTVKLPSDFPPGEAEVIVIAERQPTPQPQREPLDLWLKRALAHVPDGPAIPLEALRRESLYEDD